jgi:hypothetical protein
VYCVFVLDRVIDGLVSRMSACFARFVWWVTKKYSILPHHPCLVIHLFANLKLCIDIRDMELGSVVLRLITPLWLCVCVCLQDPKERWESSPRSLCKLSSSPPAPTYSYSRYSNVSLFIPVDIEIICVFVCNCVYVCAHSFTGEQL